MKLMKLALLSLGLVQGLAFAWGSGGGSTTLSIDGTASSISTLAVGSANVPVGRIDFEIHAKQVDGQAASGTYKIKSFACLTNGEFDPDCAGPDKKFYPIGAQNGTIQCLSADSDSKTIWFSGKITEVVQDDGRTPPEYNDLIRDQVAQGNWVMFGRLQDTNGDGKADLRSFFFDQANHSLPNVITTNGTVWSSAYLDAQGTLVGGQLKGSNACLARDAMMLEGDYTVVNGQKNKIKWLDAFTADPIDGNIDGKNADNMALPIAGVIFQLGNDTRELKPTNLKIKTG